MTLVTTGVNHITFAVSDLSRSIRFYTEVVGCTLAATWNGGAYLRAGEAWICLSTDPAVSKRTASHYTHIAFTFDPVTLRKFRTRLFAVDGAEWQVNTSEGDSVYFLDPDRHRLEAHVGSLETRLAYLRESPHRGLTLHEPPPSGSAPARKTVSEKQA